MMTRTLILLILLLGLVWAGVPPAGAQADADLYGRVNALRRSLGLSPYQRNAALDAAARTHASWMIETGQVSHVQSDGSTPRVRAQRAGYPSNVVIENIYAGSNASAGTAWAWWLNSTVHYRGLTSPNHDQIGIGTATGAWGNAYVLLFGNSTGTWSLPGGTVNTASAGAAGRSGGGGGGAPVAAPPPVFVVGVDAVGNIMHEIQPGDTLGDIALLYGYTWDDLPYVREINELDETAGRNLEIGAVLLVPPQAGTYTPTPGEPSATPTHTRTSTPSPEMSATLEGETGEAVSYTVPPETPTPTPTATIVKVATGAAPLDLLNIATSTSMPTATPLVVVDAGEVAPSDVARAVIVNERGRPAWVWLLIGLQVVIVVAAGVEMVRRQRG